MSAYLMEALKNTFIVCDDEQKTKYYLNKIKVEKVDGLIMVRLNPLSMKIYNRDGSLASMCGNGIRCLLLFALDKGYISLGENEVKTDAGNIKCNIISEEPFLCEVYLPINKCLPIRKEIFFVEGNINTVYTTNITTLSHVILYKHGQDKEKIIKRLKNGVLQKVGNICFVNLLSNKEIEVLTYEKGVGYTYSCGSGNAASFYVFYTLGLLDKEVKVINKGGCMQVSFEEDFIKIKEGARICQIL